LRGYEIKIPCFIVIFTFVPGVFEFDHSKFQMTICPKHRDEFGIDGAAGKCYVKFPWLWPPIMLKREGGKKGRFVLGSQS